MKVGAIMAADRPPLKREGFRARGREANAFLRDREGSKQGQQLARRTLPFGQGQPLSRLGPHALPFQGREARP